MSRPRFAPAALAALGALGLVLSSCGDDDDGRKADTDATETSPDTVAPDGDDTAEPDGADTIAPDGDDTAAPDGDTAEPDGDTAEPDTDVVSDDPDGDGLDDAAEAELGTDPTLADTDGDGYWDGWEANAGADPLDALSTPTLTTPAGTPYILGLVDIVEPALLRSFLGSILDRWPPILLFVEAHSGGGLTLKGGIAARVDLGPDDTAGTPDDVYALELGSLDPKTGAFQVQLEGVRTGDDVGATTDQVVIDLSNVSELVRGVRLRVEDVVFEATFVDGDQRLDPARLAGVLSRQGVQDILDNADLPLPIDIETAMQLLDPDGDGIIDVDLALEGRPAIAGGWQLIPDAEPLPRDPGPCCPPDLAVGDPIDAALIVKDQGLQPEEEALAARVIDHALAKPELVDFVATQRVVDGERRIYVYSPRGNIYFVRERADIVGVPTTSYRTVLLADAHQLEGEAIANDDARNPIADQDATKVASYEDFLAAGEPFALTPEYEELGYGAGDERLVRVPLGALPYPFGYERLSQIFDDPRAGDLVLMEPSYKGNRGSHGHLGSLQSRSPFVISGAGVVADNDGPEFARRCVGECAADAEGDYLVLNRPLRIVDVAPTIAKALGVAPTTGVGPDGFLADDNYLAWQDGRPVEGVLDGTRPSYALIIVNDGLTSMELLHQAFDPSRDLGAYRELMRRGVVGAYGAITNYPSNTYPSHNVVGSGAYSGHHGLVDNGFYEREVATVFEPIAELFSTEKFIGGAHPGLPVETLHEAVLRSFGGVWDRTDNPAGVWTASLNDPSTRGAPLATLERRVPDGYDVPDATDHLELGGTTYTYPEADLLDAEGLLDNSTITNAYGLYIANPKRGYPIPKYAIINLSSTDGAGHKAGPHGDTEREVVLKKTNDRLAMLIAILKEAGIWDDLLIVLTADHGMELKDPNVQGNMLGGLAADIGYVVDHDFFYFKQLRVTVSAGAIPSPAGGTMTLTVADRDGTAPLNLIGGATVIVTRAGVEVARGTTAADGTLTLDVPAGEGALAATVTKSGFSTEDHPL